MANLGTLAEMQAEVFADIAAMVKNFTPEQRVYWAALSAAAMDSGNPMRPETSELSARIINASNAARKSGVSYELTLDDLADIELLVTATMRVFITQYTH